MLKLLSGIFISQFIALWVANNSAQAITLPSKLPLRLQLHFAIDPGLAGWISANEVLVPVDEMSSAQILKWLVDKDTVAKALILTERQLSEKSLLGPSKNDESAEAVKADAELEALRTKSLAEIPLLLASEFAKPINERSVLLPELYLAWRGSHPLSVPPEVAEMGDKVMAETSQASCSAQKNAIMGVTKQKMMGMTDEALLKFIDVAKNYSSPSHRRKYLEILAGSLPESRRQAASVSLKAYALDMPLLAQRFSWLDSDIDLSSATDERLFSGVRRELARKRCSAAEGSLVKMLSPKISKTSLTSAIATGVEIERCYRPLKQGAQKDFWNRVAPHLDSAYGKEGTLWAKIRMAHIERVSNELEQSTATLNEILIQAVPAAQYRAVVAKAIYYLGKISDELHQMEPANKYYSDYLDQFSDQEDFEFALNGIIINLAADKKWVDMIPLLTSYIGQQSLVHIDRRPVGTVAFSLFWLGRAYLQTSHPERAREMWRRLAAEYYSTFYGALGHYLLEQSSGQRYSIEPSRVVGFNFEKMLSQLSPSNHGAATRASAFLQAGIVDEARCEIDEIMPTSPTDYDSQAIKVMLLYASGSWLDAIKIFDTVPRSYRGGLPVGFERALFPRKYADIVLTQAKKLSFDPDLVFALVRQESVFAKKATSRVGAVGLMQLMPVTARFELAKMSGNYINRETRFALQKELENPSSLYDPDANVTVGVHHLWRLMNTYKSPVFALTSYNAGASATEKWRKAIANDDWLTFIERIPFKETRGYVKLIMRNYFYYSRWYNPVSSPNQVHIDSIMPDLVQLAKDQPK